MCRLMPPYVVWRVQKDLEVFKKDLEVLKKDLEVFEKDERVFLKDPGLLSGNCYHEKPSAFFIITVLCDRFYPCNTFHINPL